MSAVAVRPRPTGAITYRRRPCQGCGLQQIIQKTLHRWMQQCSTRNARSAPPRYNHAEWEKADRSLNSRSFFIFFGGWWVRMILFIIETHQFYMEFLCAVSSWINFFACFEIKSEGMRLMAREMIIWCGVWRNFKIYFEEDYYWFSQLFIVIFILFNFFF